VLLEQLKASNVAAGDKRKKLIVVKHPDEKVTP
jgi:hypothetical protein